MPVIASSSDAMPQLKPLNAFRAWQEICESNYRKLLRLIPHLSCLKQRAVARLGGKPSLHLQLMNKTPHTVTLELSYCFSHGPEPVYEPALKLRVYLDAKMVEVLGDSERSPRYATTLSGCQVLEHKWLLNYFLDKWLDHCLRYGYRFALEDDRSTPAYADA